MEVPSNLEIVQRTLIRSNALLATLKPNLDSGMTRAIQEQQDANEQAMHIVTAMIRRERSPTAASSAA